MLNASLRPTQASNLEQLSIANPCAFLGREALRVLDITGQVAQGIDAVVDSAARAVTTAVPAGARVVTSVLPIPDTVDRAVVSSIDFITQSGVWLSKITATASMQALLLGAPAWAQAARSGVAVWGSVSELKHGDSSAQLFARCLAESSSGGSSREVPTKPSAELITEVADTTAAKLIDRVKSFYRRRLGDSAGDVVGAWERVADPAVRDASLQKNKKWCVTAACGDLLSRAVAP